jgi:asparagine synthase (glutamine-hydrolysing)
MCGFAGYLSRSSSIDTALLVTMGGAIIHRGPDDGGIWCDHEAGVGLTHRRLSIVDLSPAGHQPMLSASGRYIFAFNGEVYNHLALRAELENSGNAPVWRGHSDTETLLAGFDAWGIESTVKKSIGMFAFAVWDKHTRQLALGRDRLGEKPLYYGWQGQGEKAVFLFGSELKALREHPAFTNSINRDALTLLLRHNYIPSPYSIYSDIAKLPAGCLLTVTPQQREPQVWEYWSAGQIAESGVNQPFAGTATAAVDQLETLIKDAVRQQMMADVPLGAFLSGGIDSSTVVALMQAQSTQPVKTFTIGFHEKGYNEAVHAKEVARHLGTDHTELYVTAEQAMAVIPGLPSLYDEPFSDSSQIPTFLVSQLAKQHVTVSLSGDGGDELFCGYHRYFLTTKLWRKLALMPLPLRAVLAKAIVSIAPQTWSKWATATEGWLPRSARLANAGDKLHKGAGVLASQSIDALYLGLISHWQNPTAVVINGQEPPALFTANAPRLAQLDDMQRMMALDMLTYLPDDILVKVDRAAMGVSLETRVPFLDHRVVEFAWQLPQSLKLRDGQSKWALRQVLFRHLPKELVERPKMGFGLPIGDWLRHDLREWAEGLLDETRLRNEGFFHPEPIRQKWQEHLSGQRNWRYYLWDVLMFQAWLEKQ